MAKPNTNVFSKRRIAPRVEPLLRRSRTLQATVSQLVFDRVKEEAERYGISVSEWVSRAIDRELDAAWAPR
jgi:predicted HicB family RNase H-like nuclease